MDFSLELGTEVLQRTPDVLRAMITDLSNPWTSADEGPDTWSPYQVVGHLTYIEEHDWIDRTRAILDMGPIVSSSRWTERRGSRSTGGGLWATFWIDSPRRGPRTSRS